MIAIELIVILILILQAMIVIVRGKCYLFFFILIEAAGDALIVIGIDLGIMLVMVRCCVLLDRLIESIEHRHRYPLPALHFPTVAE